jgi:hypothetical protein
MLNLQIRRCHPLRRWQGRRQLRGHDSQRVLQRQTTPAWLISSRASLRVQELMQRNPFVRIRTAAKTLETHYSDRYQRAEPSRATQGLRCCPRVADIVDSDFVVQINPHVMQSAFKIQNVENAKFMPLHGFAETLLNFPSATRTCSILGGCYETKAARRGGSFEN